MSAAFDLSDMPIMKTVSSEFSDNKPEDGPFMGSDFIIPEGFTGVIQGLPNDTYHASDALSKSGIDSFKASPTKYWFSRNSVRKNRRVFDVGNMFHEIVQFGDGYVKKHYKQEPNIDLRSNANKEQMKEFHDSLGHDECAIKSSDWDMVRAMRDSVFKNSLARDLLEDKDTTFEDSFFWYDEETGVYCRCRADIYNGPAKLIVDLKSLDAKLSWERSVMDRGYQVQDVMYRDGVSKSVGNDCEFLFLATNKTEDSPVTEFKTMSEWHVDNGNKQYREVLQSFADCQENNSWFLPTETRVPQWALNINNRG